MNKIYLSASIFLVVTSGTLRAQKTDSTQNKAFTYSASYIGENANILKGGIKTGSAYLGMANIRLEFDTEKANLWKGGSFYVNAANTHGDEPSANFIGDFQTASNNEAGNHTYIQELWMKQTVGNVEVMFGLQDLNVEYLNTPSSGNFINSSFGIMPVLSGNLSVPIFPLTSLGVTTKWAVNENINWLNALYDGRPTDFEQNTYNLNWTFSKGDGLLGISEFQYSTSIAEHQGVYKFGVYTHNHFYEKNLPDSISHNNYGIYTMDEQMLWRNGAKELSAFVQASVSPKRYSANYYYLGAGLNFTGLFANRSSDILGLAVAHAGFKDMKTETTVEFTYKASLYSCIFIQPDIQYVIHPSGTEVALNNCMLASLRFGLSF